PGRLHCHGRTTTPTLLKRNEEIAKLKREHADEVKQLIQEMQEKHRQDKEATERKLQLLLKVIVSQNTADLDMEALAALISAPTADANSVLRSSTSTHAPNDNQLSICLMWHHAGCCSAASGCCCLLHLVVVLLCWSAASAYVFCDWNVII
ncbi:hypothetical protein A2U01_0027772, partial [Trifolium medium]|nr:hypothetical protein [Trifolium medium]